jgi:hypothetical protein
LLLSYLVLESVSRPNDSFNDAEPTSRPQIDYKQIESTHTIKSIITLNFWKYYFDIDSVDVFFLQNSSFFVVFSLPID